MPSPQLIQNPLIPTSLDGSLDLRNKTNSFQLDLRSFSSSAARLSLTNLTGDANLRVLKGDSTVLQSSNNSGKLSESILLGDINNLLAPDVYTIEVTLADGATSAGYKLNVVVNADAKLSNIWWRNSAAAQAAIWRMNGTDIAGSETYNQLPAEWEIQGVEDLDGDSEDDLLLRNMKTGEVAYWLFKGGVRTSAGFSFSSPIPLDWKIAAVKDLDGDGQADIVWHNAQQGIVALWTLKAGALSNAGTINVGANWQPLASAYLDGDAKADLVLQNSATGQVAFWKLDGTKVADGAIVTTGSSWNPQFYGDFNGDELDDVLLRDSASGAVAFWQMDGVKVKNPWATGAISAEWQIEALGNFDGAANGENQDLLWRNRRTGEIGIWLFNSTGLGFAEQKLLTFNGATYNKGANWTIAGVGDFNNDGKEDILYRNTQLGLVEVLLMNGTTITEIKSQSGVGAGWSVRGIMSRAVKAEPFEISGRTSTGGYSDATAFNLGTIEGSATYQDTVRSGFPDFFKFNTSVRSNIRLDLANNPTVQFQLFPILQNGSLGSALTYSKDMVLEIGSYAVRVFTATGTTTPYTLNVFGQPEATDIATVSFTTNVNSLTLFPSVDKKSNPITVSFKIKNTGTSPLKDVEVGFRISRDQTIETDVNTTDTPLEFVNPTGADKTIFTITTPLEPGEEREFTDVQLFLPETVAPFWLVDGKYTIGLIADPNNRLTEIDKTNNLNGAFGKDRVELTILGTETTEVIGSQMTLLSGSFKPNETVKVRFAVENIGNKSMSAGASIPIQFRLSPDSIISEEDQFAKVLRGDTPSFDYAVQNADPTLPPLGGAKGGGGVPSKFTFDVDLLLPSDTWSGWSEPIGTTFYLASWIDPNKTIPEVDVLNNKIEPDKIGTEYDTLNKNYITFTL